MAREELASELFVVLMGEVGLYQNYHKKGEALLATIGPGEFFAERAFSEGGGRTFAAVAHSDVIAVPVSSSNAPSMIGAEPELTFELLKALCTRLDEVQSAYEKAAGQPWAPAKASAQPLAPAAPEEPKQALAAAPVPPAPKVEAAPTPAGLFPEGHGSYELPLHADDHTYVMDRSFTCPYCKNHFKTPQVRSSRLAMDVMDPDMRPRYKGIEPLYYDVVTCPNCLYSALGDQFQTPENLRADLQAIHALAPAVKPLFAGEKSTATVFAGYYLALLCAPACFFSHPVTTAKLLLKLTRIYQDCGDEPMEQKTAARALDAYLYLYTHEENDDATDQQICVMLGELYWKVGDLKNARDFFFKAKTNREGNPMLRDHADNRLFDIRATLKKE